MNKLTHIALIATSLLVASCNFSSKKEPERKNTPIKVKIYATEELKECRDILMRHDASYDDQTPFYNSQRSYYQLSEKEIVTIKAIIMDKTKWEKANPTTSSPNIELYYRQYLAYKKDRDVYVLINLFKYSYIIYPNDGTLSAICPPKAITIISLAKDKSRKRNDNITVLLNLSTKQIIKISYV